MKVLVTGATGFTGAALVRRLLARGHLVVGLDVGDGGDRLASLAALGADIRLGSVVDAALVDRLVRGCDRVYHLAAAFRQVNLPRREYRQVNVEGTRNVLAAAARHGVERVLYCSTCGVHGDIERPPAGEDAPIRPADLYQQTKWEGEEVAQEFVRRGSWVTIVRPAAIYGPGDRERFAMLYRRVAGGRFVMLGKGTTQYHPVYIDDLVAGMELAMETAAARGRAYLLADENSVSLRELVVRIAEALGRSVRIVTAPFWPVYAAAALCEAVYLPLPAEPPLFRRRVDWFRQNRSFDIGRARRELGYAPAVPLADGLARTADWYRDTGLVR